MHPESVPSYFLGVNTPTKCCPWIAGSPDIFKSKTFELMVALEFLKTYLDNLLIISTASLEDHLKRLMEVLSRLHDAGFTINANKVKFCALETEFLGYIIT
jgi:hypothetical protein